jgi:hypothetical protein
MSAVRVLPDKHRYLPMRVNQILMLTGWCLWGMLWPTENRADALQAQTTTHFVFTYHENNRRLIHELAATLEKKYTEFSATWARPTSLPIRVQLTGSEKEFQEVTRQGIPDWGAGCAFPSENTIFLKARGRPWGAASLADIAAHELAHVLLSQTAGGQPVPRWFDEGLAMWAAGEWEWQQEFTMVRAALTHSLVPLADIDAVLGFGASKAGLAYAESQAAFLWLQERMGRPAMTEFIRDLPESGFAPALVRRIGLDLPAFDHEIIKFFSHRYRWPALLNDDMIFWAGITLLFVLAYLATWWRTRRIVKRWQHEDTVYDAH